VVLAAFGNVAVLPLLLPLFPLPNVVLFPQVPLPLHIFEPRYRKMVADVLEGHRAIGMTLLRASPEEDGHGRPSIYTTGCAGLIERCQPLEDGRYDLVLRGVARFRVVEEKAGEPYRQGVVEYRGDLMGDRRELDAARERVVTALEREGNEGALALAREPLPHDVFVNVLCHGLELAVVEKQSLLDCDSVRERYLQLLEILQFRQLERTWGGGGTGGVH
jgi:Lon protease-like protein